ncbi:dephospho-CoA kinase [Geobacter sp. FeAm09]|uniref:dephospho-CoA kinase n=1 Tax=Geobacter sp. FeAm09 TaxID=2597769 RepID=UPI00143D7CDC|nr:dephospho-CoA kinase [Geobacter sp. FeAm09]
MRVIGLTGGVATGKSSVARFFEERGVPVIDADRLAREAVEPGSPCLARLAALFGTGVLHGDGSLDRKRLARMVFADGEKRRQLEAVLHPEIRRLAEERIARAAAAGERIVIYMAPLLIEAGATDRVDEIWVVTVRPGIQVERLMARDGIGRDEAGRIIASQMPLAEKERHGRIVIDNSGTPEETRRLLAALWEQETGGTP